MSETKRLFVLRHAKSSWDDPGLDDHERPLAPRGRRALAHVAEYMRSAGIQPEQVLCSSSRRARETLAGLPAGGEHLIEPGLYSAGTRELVKRLRELPPDVGSAMLIGHNPALQRLVLRLTARDGGGDGSRRAALERKFPTAALATLTFDCRWDELAPGCGRLVEFVTPKALGSTSRAA